jgi:hypothetical protein
MSRRNCKRVPTSLKSAFEQDKAEGIRRKSLSVERHAELQAVSASRLYKWMEDADLPANRLAAWFHNTGGRAVIRYLCAQAGGLFVPVPSGRQPSPIEMAELQQVLAETTGALLRFYGGQADADETLGEVQLALEALAWHRGNVEKHAQPELDFEEV